MNMNRYLTLIAILLALSLLFGCAKNPPQSTQPTTEPTTAPTEIQNEPFVFTRENFPKMDGSTSLVPLAEAVASVLLGESREDVSDLVNFNRTTQSFYNLSYGDCDLLIVSEPSADAYAYMEEEGFEIEIEPIATDALIFVVNANNPVDNLTTEQVRKIYSGEITNWSEVGGNDEPIAAFQRNEGAGSQALLVKLIMKDLPMAEAPKDFVVDSMMGLMDSVKSYENTANALGYSVYYYANDMQMAEGLKILSIDGVAPNAETIRSGAYPHTNSYYCVIPANAPEDAPNRILRNWLLSTEGQRLVYQEGYVSVIDFS